MKDLTTTCRVALVQAEPALFNKEKTLNLIEKWTQKAAKKTPDLIVFPELFLPGYPYGLSFGFRVGSRSPEGRSDWQNYSDASIVVPGPETRAIGRFAKAAQAYLSIGVSERDAVSATLYNTNIIFDPEGNLVSVHRKLKPTGSERVVWGDANQDYFPIVETPYGPMGSLICWENYMPLARTALYQKGVTLYLAPNTNDNPEWQATVQHIAIEGRCFVINADLFFRKSSYPLKNLADPTEIESLPEVICRGGSSIIDPYGKVLTEPLWDQEGILYADLTMADAAASRMEFDPVGHYARPDVLHLEVKDL